VLHNFNRLFQLIMQAPADPHGFVSNPQLFNLLQVEEAFAVLQRVQRHHPDCASRLFMHHIWFIRHAASLPEIVHAGVSACVRQPGARIRQTDRPSG